MNFRKKFRNRLSTTRDQVKKTRLYLLNNGEWAIGNASSLINFLNTSLQTGASAVNARNAAVDIVHAVEDFACSDYKCFILDCVATTCDVTGSIVAFIPGNTTRKVFGAATSASYFCRTLRNKCKETNVLGCN